MKKIVFLILFLLIFIFPKGISAAGYGLSVYPPLLRVNIKPEKSITQVFRLSNLTGDDKFFVARLVPFTNADHLGNPVINLKSTAPWLAYFSLANSNIKFDEPFLIPGNTSEQLIVNLTVPANAPIRDIYATLLISTYYNDTGSNIQGSLVSATTGSNLLITISSEAYPATLLRIEDILPISGSAIKIGSYYLADNITPVVFSASVNNRGDFTAETKGIFRVTNRKGEPLYLEGLLPVNVISKTIRNLTNSDGQNFSFTPDLGKMGVYRATILIKTDNANAENSVNIIFFPFKLLLGLIFAAIFIFVISKTSNQPQKTLDTSPKK